MKKFLSILLTLAIIASVGCSFGACASASDDVIHNARYADYIKEKGIDVSSYNGDINWSKVKRAGYDFAMIRIASRDYDDASLSEDSTAKENIEGALKAGLEVGVYIFSQATSTAEAKEEANYAVNLLKSYGLTYEDITLPVVMDFEYMSNSSGLYGRLYDYYLSNRSGWYTNATSFITKFCSTVAAAGYSAMVYANKSMLESVNASKISSSYSVWLAHYTNETSYEGDYNFWQYTSSGSVKGVDGNVDIDYRYINNEFVDKGVTYAVTGDAKAEVADASSCSGSFEIPKEVNYTAYNNKTYKVTAIGAKAFYNNTKITSVKIPSTVTSVKSKAFAKCTSLKGITGATGITTIGSYAFYGCAKLQYVNNASKMTSIGSKAFAKCTSLVRVGEDTGVTSLTKLKTIGSYAFYNCSSLTSVKLPSTVTSIKTKTFVRCTSLKSVTGCSGLTDIAAYAFYKCTKLQYIKNAEKVASIGNKAFAYCSSFVRIGSTSGKAVMPKIASIGDYAFYNCKKMTAVKVSSAALTSIGQAAFKGCAALTSFSESSAKLKSIGKQAFYGDSKLSSVTFKSAKLTSSNVGANAFAGIKNTCTFKVPSGKGASYKKIFKAKGASSKIVVKKA